jgi:hypothetical protein
MEKKTRSSRKVPAGPGDMSDPRNRSHPRRPRTLADSTNPRTPAQRNNHNNHYDYDEQAYATRDNPSPSGTPHFTLPSHPAMPAMGRDTARRRNVSARERQQATWDEYGRDGEEWPSYQDDDDPGASTGRSRAQSSARPLALMHIPAPAEREVYRDDDQDAYKGAYQNAASAPRALVTADSVPDLVAWRPPVPAARKPIHTRAIETARRNPWSLSRIALTLIVVSVTLVISLTNVGEPSQPLMQFFNAQAAGANASSIADKVQPLTQGKRVDQYDSVAQYNEYWGAACSAAVLAETLTAWGIPNATIGRMIDELGSNISPYGGLLSYNGFQQVAAKHQMRSDFRENLTYKQMLYITNTLHLPLIVNVRISYGFYHFFSGGHFLVMTAGDDQGVRLVDSSLYYVHYMPLSVFNGMFTGRTVLLLPSDYVYTLPK